MSNIFNSDIDEVDVFGAMFLPDNYTPEDLKKVSNNIRLFKNIFTQNVFEGVYYMTYEVIQSLTRLSPRITRRQFKSAITNSLGIFVNIPEVKVDEMTEADDQDTKLSDMLQVAMAKFDEYQDRDVDEDSFKANSAILADRIKQQKYQEILLNAYQIAHDGSKVKGRFMQGAEAADKYYNSEMAQLNNMILDANSKSMAIKSGVEGLQDVLANMQVLRKTPICSFGIDPIDATIGELKTSEMLAIFGGPKTGKSRKQASLVHSALVNGHDSCIFQLEGTPLEYSAMLEARHMVYLYGANPVTDEMILDGTIPEEWQANYRRCREDLYTNPAYGQFNIQPGPLYLETMESQILNEYHSWRPFKVLVVDYPTLVMSNTNKSDTEIVSQVFRRLKSLITFGVPGGMLGIIPHQMQTETFKELKKGFDDGKGKRKGGALDASGGADSAESVKSPDIVVGLFANKELKDLNQMYIYFVAGRRKKPFPDTKVRTQLGQCVYSYDPTLEEQELDD